MAGAVVNVAYSTIEGEVRVVAIDKKGQEITSSRTRDRRCGRFRPPDHGHFWKTAATHAREFRFQARPYRWVEFNNVALQPAEKIEAEKKLAETDNPWIAKLPQEHRTDGRFLLSLRIRRPWWKPDGSPFMGGPFEPFDSRDGLIVADKNMQNCAFLFHLPDLNASINDYSFNLRGGTGGTDTPSLKTVSRCMVIAC